jgi:hypothetical protein
MILLVHLEMLGEIRDAVGENRDLDLRRSAVSIVPTILLDQTSSCLFQ